MIVDLEKRWMDKHNMACVNKNPEMFFVDIGQETLANPSRKVQRLWNRAKAVCNTCPVMRECARDNLGEHEGVWGGLDPKQRVELRVQHAHNVRRLTGSLKEEYAALAYYLRHERRLPFGEIGRLMGLPFNTCQYLYDWEIARRNDIAEPPAVEDLELPDDLADVVEIKVDFPDKPPASGADLWVRYGRRVTHGYYLGQTEDDAWFYVKIKLLASEYSICWIKSEDVKLARNVARNVLTRVGNGSRIYGEATGSRKPAEAG